MSRRRNWFEGTEPGDHWGGGHTLLMLMIVIAIGVLVALADLERFNPGSQTEPAFWVWLALIALMAAFVFVVGDGVVGRAWGVLIGERNRMSLARLQMATWTILVLSAYLTAMLLNVAAKRANPLAVSIPTELWLAMGISTTSLLGSRLILGSDDARGLELRESEPVGRRRVATRPHLTEAKPSDLFCGDFEAGRNALDLTKVQMFFFTIVLVLGYGVATAELFIKAPANGIPALPKLDEAFVILLAISHATYLTRKALPDTRSASGAPSTVSSPALEGAAVVGQTLRAEQGSWRPEPDEVGYRWERCDESGSGCVRIDGAETQTYTVAARDLGKRIRVTVIGSSAAGLSTATSALSDVVRSEAEWNALTHGPPHNLTAPVIRGRTVVGETLSAETGTWAPKPDEIRLHWERCEADGTGCVSIAGEEGPSYTLVDADRDKRIRVKFVASTAAGKGTATSPLTEIVA